VIYMLYDVISSRTFYSFLLCLVICDLLQLKDLRVGQWEEPCIGLIQENSVENFVQDGLLYI